MTFWHTKCGMAYSKIQQAVYLMQNNTNDNSMVWIVLIIFQQIIVTLQIKINNFNEESLELAVVKERNEFGWCTW